MPRGRSRRAELDTRIARYPQGTDPAGPDRRTTWCTGQMPQRPRTFDRLDGPPFALPRLLDRASEAWWSRAPRWRAAGILLAIGVLVVLGLAHASATPYGPPTTVLVATRDLPAGHQLTRDDLRRATWPDDLAPHDGLERAEGRLASALPEGSPATRRHVADDGVAATLPEGTAAVPVPIEGLPILTVGNRVEVVGRNLDGRAAVLANDGSVVAIDDTDVWLAIPAAQAADVAAAGASGMVTVVVLPP